MLRSICVTRKIHTRIFLDSLFQTTMYLQHVVVENFLSFQERREVTVRDGKLFIVGENGSGKTNFIRAIEFAIKHCNKLNSVKMPNFVLDESRFKVQDSISPQIFGASKPSLIYLKFKFDEEDLRRLNQNPGYLEIGIIRNQDWGAPIHGFIVCNGVAVHSYQPQTYKSGFQRNFKEISYKSVVEVLADETANQINFNQDLASKIMELIAIRIAIYSTNQHMISFAKETYLREKTVQRAFNNFFPELFISAQQTEDFREDSYGPDGWEIQFKDSSNCYNTSEVSSGMLEVLTIMGSFFNSTTIIFDEPGKTLHPFMISKLRRLFSSAKHSIVVITHRLEFIAEETVNQTVRFVWSKQRGTTINKPVGNDNHILKWVCDPLRLPLFFAKGALFVEGDAEVRLFSALASCLQDNIILHPELKEHEFIWDVIPMGSKDKATEAQKVTRYSQKIPFAILLDFDALINDKKHKQIMTWTEVQQNWKYASSSVVNKLGVGLESFSQNEPIPESAEEAYKQFVNLNSKQVFVWPPSVRDIEGVTGVKKSSWRDKNFEDLKEIVYSLLECHYDEQSRHVNVLWNVFYLDATYGVVEETKMRRYFALLQFIRFLKSIGCIVPKQSIIWEPIKPLALIEFVDWQ